jgi:hypothetical protein
MKFQRLPHSTHTSLPCRISPVNKLKEISFFWFVTWR